MTRAANGIYSVRAVDGGPASRDHAEGQWREIDGTTRPRERDSCSSCFEGDVVTGTFVIDVSDDAAADEVRRSLSLEVT
jgi:hypothetical protein